MEDRRRAVGLGGRGLRGWLAGAVWLVMLAGCGGGGESVDASATATARFSEGMEGLQGGIERGPLGEFDTWTTEAMAAEGGGSAHEARTWIAAFASLAAVGSYTMDLLFYEPIPAWIAGFAVATAQLTEAPR